MKKLLFILLFLPLFSFSQHIMISGTFSGSDSVNIFIYFDGSMIAKKSTTDMVYSIVLGEMPHYTIKFVSGSRIKYLHVLNTGIKPEHYAIDIDFKRPDHLILYKDFDSQKKVRMETYRRMIKSKNITF